MATSVRSIKGIGEKTEKLLKKLNIETVEQLIHHYPRCYTTYPDPIPIADIEIGVRCSVYCQIDSPIHMRSFGKRKVVSCLLADQTGSLFVRWFNMPYLKSSLHQGDRLVFTGTPVFKDGRRMMEQPEYCRIEIYRNKMETFQPVYPLTAGLSNQLMRKALKEALLICEPQEYLPENVRKYYELDVEKNAVKEVHFPTSAQSLDRARTRVIFDEFFRFFSALELVKDREEKALNTHVIPMDERVEAFIEDLPFPLTGAQKRTVQDIRKDFSGTVSMNRLIQGDVGSGKTIVAVIAIYAACLAGCQSIMMAPTEVLAEQHYATFCSFLNPYGIHVGLLTGSTRASEKKKIRLMCQDGSLHVLVGTHAVIQDNVLFSDLGLVITDEQHRFGVKQRDRLMKKGADPHVLVMSATPIPRTLGIILYRDLDVSIMDELPASRLPIKNSVVGVSYRPAAWAFMRKQVLEGRQCYVICPMIAEDEKLSLENVEEYSRMLSQALPPSIRVEALTGKMKADQKNEIMSRFSRGEIDILVSTTVIEVGIDVKNATVMLIENAERFGLAQLHQLRGRVGRGIHQSYCIFISGTDDQDAMKRLSVVGRTNNGFEIANEDLKLRGPGEFFGTRQSGTMDFAMGDIYKNADILKMAAQTVDYLKEEGYNFREIPGYGQEEDLNYARDI